MTIKLLTTVSGIRTEWDNSWVVEYDPGRKGYEGGYLEITNDRSKARQFATPKEAMAYWRQVYHGTPIRPDGKANRPLTAWSVEIK